MTTQAKADPGSPVLLALSQMVELFPVAKTTVYRWNSDTSGRRPRLPEPDLVIAGKPLWRESVVLDFAAELGHQPDPVVLDRIRAERRGG